MIENIKYKILTKSEQEAEVIPQIGQTFELSVRKLPDNTNLATAMITAEQVTKMGDFYTRVIGRATVEENKDMPCDAIYEIKRLYPEFTPIGELTLSRVSET